MHDEPSAAIAPADEPQALHLSVFPDLSARTIEPRTMPWAEVVEMIRRPDEWPSKHAMPLLKLATFGDNRTDRGSLRHDGNIVELSGVEGDYDAGQMPMGEALRRLEAAGIRAALYTSPNHRPEAPRWRVLAPLSVPRPPHTRSALVARLNGALGGVLADESFTVSQVYFYGRVRGAPYQTAATFDDPDDGTCVDELDELDEIAVGRASTAPVATAPTAAVSRTPAWDAAAALVQQLGRKLRTGDGRRELLKSYVGSRSVRGFARAELRALVDRFAAEFFDPDDPLDGPNITAIIGWACSRDEATRAHGAAIAQAIDPAHKVAQIAAESPPDEPAPDGKAPAYVSLGDLDTNPPPPREWVIDEWLPLGAVTALFAGGGFGKSLLSQQIATCVANGVPFCGRAVRMGPVLGIFTEDDADELRRRQCRILASMGRTARFSTSDLHLSARAGESNTMMVPRQFSRELDGTAFGWSVVDQVKQLRPSLLILDNLAQLFGGMENDRFQATYFANWLSSIALRFRCAVLLLGHVAKAEGSEFSGSTAWDAAVRSRWWLERRDDGTLELHKSKANYAKRESVVLEFRDGALAHVDQKAGGAAESLVMAQARRDVLAALDALTARQIATSQAPNATTYLPRLASKEKALGTTGYEAARRALGALIDEGEIICGVELPWRKNDRTRAVGLARKAAE